MKGVVYFPLDVNMDQKMRLIEMRYGVEGFGVVIKLWQYIYGSEGYFTYWDRDRLESFAYDIHMDREHVSDIIGTCLERGLFDKDLFKEYGILTSKGIQERYFLIVKRRKDIDADGRYLLVDVDNLSENVNIFNENVNIFEQRKKRKERKENKEKKPGSLQATVKSLNEMDLAEQVKYLKDLKSR